MIDSAIFQPVIALILWTMVIWIWMYATRLPAFDAAKIDASQLRGGTGSDLDAMLPAEVQWKAHNYNHLLAEPTLFYAVCIVLGLIGMGSGFNLGVAWIYVALRVAHSLVQCTVNIVKYRALLFFGSSACIMILALRAAYHLCA